VLESRCDLVSGEIRFIEKKTEEGHYRLVDAGTDYGVGFDSMGNERRSMGPGREQVRLNSIENKIDCFSVHPSCCALSLSLR
jgi:hypothetical protein